MREILFRGKSVTDGRWVFGDLSNYGDYKTITTLKDFSIIDSCEVIPETVGQYTGLKGKKNGKKIFEGDILSIKCADGKSRLYPVYFGTYHVDGFGNNFHIGFYIKYFDEDISLGFLADSNDQTDFEAIGNIYDTPELLGGDKTRILI